MTRDFTVSVFIYYRGKVLLHLHKKLNSWLPVGGHIDANELPQEAVFREIKEECGLEVELLNIDKYMNFDRKEVIQLIKPSWILLENIEPTHQHIDFVYIAKAKTTKIKPEENESKKFKWVTKNDLVSLDCFENVGKIVPEVINYFNE